jgi:DNA-binding response OmpR family regulator
MNLSFEDKIIELTSKEADLLFLLYSAANNTLERKVILNTVWGDEGDYVGRTLDVFISKLRKKLEADSNLKIVNIHGVGYKFVMND